MKPATRQSLNAAHRLYGQCAAKVRQRSTSIPGHFSVADQNQIRIRAFGTARDYVRWAAALDSLQFTTAGEQRSARREGITESIRFMQMWTAANALFAQNDVLRLVGVRPERRMREFERFEQWYDASRVDPRVQQSCVSAIYDLLDMECDATGVTRVITAAPRARPNAKRRFKPNPKIAAHPKFKVRAAPPVLPTMWEVIHQKYFRSDDRTRPGIGQNISGALAERRWPMPDAVSLIYAARNWTVHGMLLTSFFRGSKRKYQTFIENIQLLLGAALEGFGRAALLRL